MKNEATKIHPALTSLSSCRESRTVRLSLRIAVKLVMLVSAAVVGYESFLLLSRVQREAQRQQYLAVARKIQSSTLFSMNNRLEALTMGVSTFLQFCPNASQWPSCAIPFDLFLEGFDPLTRMTESRALTTVVTVMPPEVPLFENFSYSFFEESGFPDLGLSPFGRGIYAINTSTGERFHDTTGESCPSLPRRLLLPILQVTNLAVDSSTIMYNAYSDFPGGRTYDQAFDCVQRNGLNSPAAFSVVRDALDCVSFSGFIQLVQDVEENKLGRPSTLTVVPIVPRAFNNASSNTSVFPFTFMNTNANENTQTEAHTAPFALKTSSSSLSSLIPAARGFFGVAFNWDSLLALAGTERVTGIQVVIQDPFSMVYTFLYDQGIPKLQGEGDLHSSRYENQAFVFAVSGNYTLSLYPTRAWISLYENEMPIILCVVFVGLGVFTCVVFYLYDLLLNREALHQEAVMRTKRQYLRYISHEIRTPLNVVHLGFSVLLLEIVQFADVLRKRERDTDKERTSESAGEEKREEEKEEEAIERSFFGNSVEEEEKEEEEEEEEQEEEEEETKEDEEEEQHESQESCQEEAKETETAETPGKDKPRERRSSKLLWSERLQRREEEIQRRAALSVPLSLAERNSLSQHLREWLELVSDMVESAQASVDVLNALLDYDKIEAQAMPLRREPLKVWSMVSSAVRPFLVQAKAKHISLTVDVTEFEESDSGKERGKQEEEREQMEREENKDEKKVDQRDRESGSERSVGLDSAEMEKEREREIDREREIALLSLSPSSLQWLREQEVVFGDRAKLHQVLRNLVSNALKFTPMEGRVSVRMHCRPLSATEKTLRREMERARARRIWKRTVRVPRNDSSSSIVSNSEIASVAPNAALLALAAEEERQWLWEGTAVISVRDTGVGMSAENVKRVFEEGVQFNPNQLQAGQGSGLGLWISQGIVRLHQGRLYACSEGEGKGSEFVLELPLFRPREMLCLLEEGGQSAEAKEEAPKILPAISHHELWKTYFRRVLVVDDSSTSRRMLCRSLVIEGCVCTQACDGLECVEMVLHTKRGQFDLILLDYEMPNLTGPEAAAILRAEGVGLPIVGVTGHVLEEDIKFFVRHGADRVLHKPFTPVELENVLMELASSFQKR